MTRMINIEHPQTGERYAVTPADYRKHYEDRGFVAGNYEDGEEYIAPESKKPVEKSGK